MYGVRGRLRRRNVSARTRGVENMARQKPNGFAKIVDYVILCGGTLGGTRTLLVILSQFRVKKITLRVREGQTRSFCRMSTSRPYGEAGIGV
jgi:hypothetical protein